MFAALAANYGSLQSKVKLFLALAPVAEMANTTESFLDSVANQWRLLMSIQPLTGVWELGDPATTPSMSGFCSFAKSMCNQL